MYVNKCFSTGNTFKISICHKGLPSLFVAPFIPRPLRIRRITLPIFLKSQSFNALLDTDASLSAIDECLGKDFPESTRELDMPSHVLSAANEIVPVRGWRMIEFELANQTYTHPMLLIRALDETIVIGLDLLTSMAFDLDLPNRKVYLNGKVLVEFKK